MQQANKTLVRSTTKTANVNMPKPLFIEPVNYMMTTSLFMTEKMYVFGVQASHTCINKHMYTHTHTHVHKMLEVNYPNNTRYMFSHSGFYGSPGCRT